MDQTGTSMLEKDFSLAVDEEIVLKIPQLEEASILFNLIEKNREHLREYLGWVDGTRSKEDSAQFIQTELKKASDQQALCLFIWFREKLVGVIGCVFIDQLNRSTTIGYWLDQEHQSRGIMTRSIKALIDYIFQVLGLHRIEIQCAVNNIKSQKIPKRLGFQLEGTLKEAIRLDATYVDVHVFGLLNPKHGGDGSCISCITPPFP